MNEKQNHSLVYCGVVRPYNNGVCNEDTRRIEYIADMEQLEALKPIKGDDSYYYPFKDKVAIGISPQYRAALCFSYCQDNKELFYIKISVDEIVVMPTGDRMFDLSIVKVKVFGFRNEKAEAYFHSLVKTGSIKIQVIHRDGVCGVYNFSNCSGEYEIVVPREALEDANKHWYLTTEESKQ